GSTAAWYGDRTEIVVVETDGTATYAAALAHGAPTDIEVSGIAADALGATRLGSHPWDALHRVGATSVVVSDADVVAARRQLWSWLRIVVEPAAAAPVAALITGAWRPTPGTHIGIVVCGANTTLDLTP
ncbi:MAG TPA: pyridoxal-phosphate dependent enzyme, partial [Ilumatobacter sp.]